MLAGVPRESFPPGYVPGIVREQTLVAESIPGFEVRRNEISRNSCRGAIFFTSVFVRVCAQRRERIVCDIVSCQLEVWWEVVPLRFAVQPPVVRLPHSRRVTEATAAVCGVQLGGVVGIGARWTGSAAALPRELQLSPTQLAPVQLHLALPPQPDRYPAEDLVE